MLISDSDELRQQELFSSEQMEIYGKALAKSHKLSKGKSSDKLLGLLDDNEKILFDVHKQLVGRIKLSKNITPAAEWLLDNFYLIEEQIATARKHLPKKYSEELPCLAEGLSKGMPRVYGITQEMISHRDGRVEKSSLFNFIAAYQKNTILTLGELWAIPIMLRLSVIGNLSRISRNISFDMTGNNLAKFWADKMIEAVKEEPGNLILIIADMVRSKPDLTGSFVAAFIRKIHGKGPELAFALNWLEQQLLEIGSSGNDIVRKENQKQAADQVSMQNCISTLRFLDSIDWAEFVETLSSVEKVLIQDPAGIYPLMDFETRDKYRKVIESLSRTSNFSETEVAGKVLELTQKKEDVREKSLREKHVGYYLIDKGLKQTEEAIQAQYSLKQKLIHSFRRKTLWFYLLPIVLITFAISYGMIYFAYIFGIYNLFFLSFLSLLLILCSSQFAVSLVNWISTICIQPTFLPKLDFMRGIPSEYRTLVVVPTMLLNENYIKELIDDLEIRYLSNSDPNLHFALITDFKDADAEIMPEDDALLEQVSDGIKRLNQKYKQIGNDIFFLFHRPRIWNKMEKKWMGYERKRGKLAALNAFITGGNGEDFSLIINNNPKLINKFKYVITLDSDTLLPRDTAKKFIGAMAHPLNHAIYSHTKKRVTDGYGILQPRLGSSIPKRYTTKYLRMHGNVSGIDPYTRISSDVYQDLFGEGSFIGKGIYDVKVFKQAVCNVFRENCILSHDLIEGCYARSGLLSDVILYEEGVARYDEDIKRHHRWIRGDWQLVPWVMPFINGNNGRFIKNKLSILSWWKIFDNLRRSLIPFSSLLLLLISWSILPFPGLWTLFVIIILLLPVMTAAGWQLIRKPTDITIKTHLSEVALTVSDILILFLFEIAVLPYEAYKYADAIIRTNWRMAVTHRKLLEWTPSAITKNRGNRILSVYRTMWIAPVLGFVVFCFYTFSDADILFAAIPVAALWLFTPIIVWLVSMPEKEKDPKLLESQILFLHKSARKTWAFFEKFVTAEENWLPPDNFQKQPRTAIAHRTSPTNIGLALLANLTAYDFGYISGIKLASRCSNTLKTMSKLDRYKGHFYNWYDTISLLPLPPKYVSTVDSGNLAGHLLVLKQGLICLPSQPIFNRKIYEGIKITVMIIDDFSKGNNSEKIETILDLLNNAGRECNSLSSTIKNLDELISYVDELKKSHTLDKNCLYNWIILLYEQIKNIRDDIVQLIPWLDYLPLPERFIELKELDGIPTLQQISVLDNEFMNRIEKCVLENNSPEDKEWLNNLRKLIICGSRIAFDKIMQIEKDILQCEVFSNMEYGFLLNKSTNLLMIGYNAEENRKDNSYYDLLASEERLGIFVAIAQGKLSQKSWFALGRLLTSSGRDPVLLSWSGSMFEYLMPQLVMPCYKGTLLYETGKTVVKRQIEYAEQRKIPWGISESAYNMVGTDMSYQYRAFGVPGIGLKRGLEKDLVIAPYATMLALMVSPEKACLNLQRLSKEGFEGEFGFFEAVDYTESRLPKGMTNSIVQSYMVHHQGMGLLSLAYILLDRPMQKRFHTEPRFAAALQLLQERIPRVTLFYAHTAELIENHFISSDIQSRSIDKPDTPIPEIQLMGNGRYQVMITNSGGGYSHWKNIAVTRWREDSTKDNYGIFCYIKDVDSGMFWSNTYHPTLHPTKDYKAIFSQGIVEFQRHDYGIDTKTEIVISPEDDIELRRIRLTNKTQTVKVLEITSYAEIVLAEQASDEAHPAFSNLFVQTAIQAEDRSIFCTRRPRSAEEKPPWMFHLMDVHDAAIEAVSYETDRMKFIGRGKTPVQPQAMKQDLLSGSQGSVLDPIMSIRYRIILRPNKTARIDLIYGISENKKDCESLMHKYHDEHLRNRAFALSWTHSQILLHQIHASEADAQLYNSLASSVIYSNSNLRVESSVVQNNFRGQSDLWRYSISGDLPIVLLYIYNTQGRALAKQMIQAHAYWCLKGLAVDLVIVNEDHTSYRQVLQDDIQSMITVIAESNSSHSQAGRIYTKHAEQITSEDRVLFESVARVIIYHNRGALSEQVNNYRIEKTLPPLLEKSIQTEINDISLQLSLPDNLLHYNGIGGFTSDGREYKILTDNKETTPAPWVNVIANPDFGSVVSETGSAYTWAVNSHEYRITPWNNDPVSDIGGEAFYLRDEETGVFWSPSPFPKRGRNNYITTHGFGYTLFEHAEHGISTEMRIFVDKALPIKFIVLKLKNNSGKIRKFSATGFIEIIMGDVRSKTNMHIISAHDSDNSALLIRNRYNSAFSNRVTFFKVNDRNISFTADRSEFIGRNRNLNNPQAMYRKRLSGRIGACLDPCAALQVKFSLFDQTEREIIFQIGNEENLQAATDLINKFTDNDSVIQAFRNAKEYWKKVLGAFQIKTPDVSLNILTNGWLLYQTICCRLFARSGFYQSGGAFGFRDQLQDVLALLYTQPSLVREQILLSASRQFAEGDVQHWWHPPEGRGVRTRCSDDLLWLPFVVSRYITATGDTDILSIQIGFLESRHLHDDEDSLYDLPASGNLSGTLYEHCVRSIKYSLRFGKHGLPLIGSGDWNDGMDRIGNKGQGESVWLAFFMYDILISFADTACNYGDTVFSEICKKRAIEIQSSVETFGWDGNWFIRAYFDDGTPLGTKNNEECRIDAIAQSWAVLSGATGHKRSVAAMNSVDKYLVRKDMKLIKLLDPPFDAGKCNPGYIKGYLPGVRENGGQYSHAAVWALMAFASLGEREKVWELFSMIHPLNHSSSNIDIQMYKVEPYVMAADIYANEYHKGRGGWTWYTGSAGWMYQFIIGFLLGIELKTDVLVFKPCFPLEWASVSLDYHFKKSRYKITVFQSDNSSGSYWEMEGNHGKGNSIKLVDDGMEHEVKVYISK